ncbi:MAG: hypothetical protein AAGC55_31030, partial [Myxococcota bacterium]
MRRMRIRIGAALVLALVAVVASPGAACADSHNEATADGGGDSVERMTLPAGTVLFNLPLEVNLSSNSTFKPASIGPDLWYGISDRLTAGLVHSTVGSTGLYGSTPGGSGLCFTGESNGCPELYDNIGVDIRYNLLDGGFVLAADVGVFATALDPQTLAAKAGFQGKLGIGPLALLLGPNIFVGITERDTNKEFINAPVGLALSLGVRFSIGVQSGIAAPLDGLADNFTVPLSTGVRLVLSRNLVLDAAFTFPQIAGGSNIADIGI